MKITDIKCYLVEGVGRTPRFRWRDGLAGDTDGTRPGDDYNDRAAWGDILGAHGWQAVNQAGSVTRWRRPGKDGRGWSATTGYTKEADLLCVFSTNADPFEGPNGQSVCTAYTKFAAYALLNWDSDFKAAASALGRQGFGPRQGRAGAVTGPPLPPYRASR